MTCSARKEQRFDWEAITGRNSFETKYISSELKEIKYCSRSFGGIDDDSGVETCIDELLEYLPVLIYAKGE